MPSIRLGVALLIALMSAATATADTIHFKNGDAITGTITGYAGGTIAIDTDYAGTLQIAPSAVRWIETDGEIMVLYPGQEPRTLNGDQTRELDLDQIDYIGPPLPTEPVNEIDWTGTLDAQLSIRVGETDTYDAVTGFAVTRSKDRRLLNDLSPVSRLKLSVTGAYGESDGDVNTQRALAEQRYRYYFDQRLYLLQLSALRHDDQRDLDLRATAGLGLGYDVIDKQRRTLAVDGALTYDYERWQDPDRSSGIREENNLNLLLGLHYEERFQNDSTLTNELELTPQLDDLGEYRLVNTAAYTAPINQRTDLRFQWRAEYESNPGPDVQNWDNLFTSGIRYEF